LPDGGFDRILVHGSVAAIPTHWRAALEPGGRLVTGLSDGGRCRLAVLATPEAEAEPGPPARLATLVPGLARVL
jgi:protein-L-isoaspartate(D-aspartate) O-methyltransferase